MHIVSHFDIEALTSVYVTFLFISKQRKIDLT